VLKATKDPCSTIFNFYCFPSTMYYYKTATGSPKPTSLQRTKTHVSDSKWSVAEVYVHDRI